MPTVTVDGVDLSYESHGTSGDPVVLVHGSWVDQHSWDLVVPGLSQALQVVTYDRRGHGLSSMGPRPHPVRVDAADLAGLLTALDHYPAHIIAHSYGGAVALRLASDHPEMVRSLAIHEPAFVGLLASDPTTAPEAERLMQGVHQMQALIRAGHPEAAAEQLVDQFSTEPGAWDRMPQSLRSTFVRHADRWAEEYADPDALAPDRAALHELLIPVLLTEGSLSPPFLHRITQALAALLRNEHIQELPDVGHAPHLARPHQYVGLLVNFLLERNVPGT
jgi:pimeloyl-ACP methyl ester carboxylesterase